METAARSTGKEAQEKGEAETETRFKNVRYEKVRRRR